MKTILKCVGMALVMSLLLGGQAHAEISVERRSILVNIAGLDLRTEAGRDLVYRKLRWAAKRACIDVESRHNLSSMLYSRCVNDALTEAVSQVPDPLFSATCGATLSRHGTAEHGCTEELALGITQCARARPALASPSSVCVSACTLHAPVFPTSL